MFAPSVHALFSVLSGICASIEELVTCGNSDLNKSTKTLSLDLAISISSISSSYASIFEGNASFKCSKACSSEIPITLPKTIFKQISQWHALHNQISGCANMYTAVSSVFFMIAFQLSINL